MAITTKCIGSSQKINEQLITYCNRWFLSNPIKLTESQTSHIYKVNHMQQEVVLKLLTEIGVEDEKYGAISLQCFAGSGAAAILEHDERAHLLEYIRGPNLKNLVDLGKDTEATKIIAFTLKNLHAIKNTESLGFPSLRERFTSLYKAARYNSANHPLFQKAATIVDLLLEKEKDLVLLHGDLHHENILYSDTRGWLSIDPKGIFGERTYDTANILYNPTNMSALVVNETRIFSTLEILATELGYDLNRLLAFAFVHGCLSASWSIEDNQDASLALSIARILESRLCN